MSFQIVSSHALPTSRAFVFAVSAAFCLGLFSLLGAHNAEAKTTGAKIHAAHSSTAVSVGVNVGVNYRPHYRGYGRGYYPYYSGYRAGYWNSYYRPRFSIGFYVPILPIGYSTFWYGARPYYYYDDVYYVNEREGYRVVERPNTDAAISPGPAPVIAAPPVVNGPAPTYVDPEKTGQLFAYPRNNQSATTATFDRIECERWGTQQTGFQPAQSPDNADVKASYQRAVAACLEGRGYSVK